MANAAETVTVDNFARAETDRTLKVYVEQGAFGKFLHFRELTPIDAQTVIRSNRDTLYSMGVFDLTNPVTIVKPDSGDRYMSMQIINEDHSMQPTIHEAGTFTFTQEEVGTRYLFLLYRTFIDANDPADIKKAQELQDQIVVKQDDTGSFKVPEWDKESLDTVRNAINILAGTRTDTNGYFGNKDELNPLYHLLGTAQGWAGNPPEAAMYLLDSVDQNNGKTPHSVTVKDVPVTGFWSITVYNKDGFMEPNDMDAYSYNNITAEPNDDGSITINFGACEDDRVNCLPITEDWGYTVRLYRPGPELIDGSWAFPEIKPTM
ncbi:MAG: DUF1214 domain-containing protein [Planctomycetia bacterium]|nr:DUF1214 domain-containing protein [Planctomycetia bacterium]